MFLPDYATDLRRDSAAIEHGLRQARETCIRRRMALAEVSRTVRRLDQLTVALIATMVVVVASVGVL